MSFSKDVKNEILKKNVFRDQTEPFLTGLFLSCGSLTASGSEFNFSLSLDTQETAEFVVQKIAEKFGDGDFKLLRVLKNFGGQEKFELVLPAKHTQEIFKFLGNNPNDWDYDKIFNFIEKEFSSKQEMVAFLIGEFIATGTISVPKENTVAENNGYHFEMDFASKKQAELTCQMLSELDIFPKMVLRKDRIVVYVKSSETICDVLGQFGASKAVLEIETQKVERDMNNLANRQTNCISANIDRTVNAALKQLEAIKTIQSTIGIENLPDNLCEVALLRVGNPESSMSELLSLMENKITKGALAQRFEKIIKISKELGENNGV